MNTRNGRSDRIRTCGIVVPNHARYQLRYTPKTSQDLLAENRLSAVADRLFGFSFSYYTMFFSKSQDFFGFFFSFGEAGIDLPKSTSIVFCICPKGREKHEKQMVEKGVGGTSCSIDSRVRRAGACKGNSYRIR